MKRFKKLTKFDRSALEKSVIKYTEVAMLKKSLDVASYKLGASGCPLCAKYYDEEPYCERCPVKIHTGEQDCEGTPWHAGRTIKELQDSCIFGRAAESFAALRKRCAEMANFLQSLLDNDPGKA